MCVLCLALPTVNEGRVTPVVATLTELVGKKKRKWDVITSKSGGCAPGSFTLIEFRYLPLIRLDPPTTGTS